MNIHEGKGLIRIFITSNYLSYTLKHFNLPIINFISEKGLYMGTQFKTGKILPYLLPWYHSHVLL